MDVLLEIFPEIFGQFLIEMFLDGLAAGFDKLTNGRFNSAATLGFQ